MHTITSTQNNLIKSIVALKHTQARKKSGLFCAEGIKLTNEIIRSNYSIAYCFISENYDDTMIPQSIPDNIIYKVSSNVMNKLTSLSTHQGIITVAKEKEPIDICENDNFILALDTIQDPANIGAILRSAEAFGVKHIILGNGCCDCYSVKALRSSMGSIFRLNIINSDLKVILPKLKSAHFDIIGAGLDKNFKTVDKLKESDKKVVIIGNEGNGISEIIKTLCDFGMYIPMLGNNESLNAAVAASIIMWENTKIQYER